MSWQIFERAAEGYEAWYTTARGRRVDLAERALLAWLLASFAGVRSALDVGCGTGHFAAWLQQGSIAVIGLDRSPAMLAELRRGHAAIPVVVGDASSLPVRSGAVDVVMLVTALEFVEQPDAVLSEAVRVARQGLVLVALNRWSLGGLSRRIGPRARRPILGSARDMSLVALRRAVRAAAGERLRSLRWASSLFPDGLWAARYAAPLGDVIGMAVALSPIGRRGQP
ncbi:MAG TPA: class I SAM-dependent methyltransferase [Candidatus Nitrosotalea sp.]|nr:class I SAM-dependent methyltransferase [Candidatus Nitrosotalea sp.]